MRSRLYFILIPLLALVTILGAAIGIYNMQTRNTGITDAVITLDGKEITTSEVNLAGMAPGENRNYTLTLSANRDDVYTITMDFQRGSKASLGEFVQVRISIGDRVIEDKLLKQLFDGSEVRFDCELGPDHDVLLDVTYMMPATVGNEAQGKDAEFIIVLSAITAEKEGNEQ